MTAECSATSWAGLTTREWTRPSPDALSPCTAGSLRRTEGPDDEGEATSPIACRGRRNTMTEIVSVRRRQVVVILVKVITFILI